MFCLVGVNDPVELDEAVAVVELAELDKPVKIHK